MPWLLSQSGSSMIQTADAAMTKKIINGKPDRMKNSDNHPVLIKRPVENMKNAITEINHAQKTPVVM